MVDIIGKYLIEEALVVIPVLLILGKVIKEMEFIKDKFIPVVLLGLGIAFTVALLGFDVDGIIQGVLVTGGAVFGHQLYKQSKEID